MTTPVPSIIGMLNKDQFWKIFNPKISYVMFVGIPANKSIPLP